MRGTSPDNAEWIRRKRNVVNRFHKSSYAIGLRLQQRNSTLEERYGLGLNGFCGQRADAGADQDTQGHPEHQRPAHGAFAVVLTNRVDRGKNDRGQ